MAWLSLSGAILDTVFVGQPEATRLLAGQERWAGSARRPHGFSRGHPGARRTVSPSVCRGAGSPPLRACPLCLVGICHPEHVLTRSLSLPAYRLSISLLTGLAGPLLSSLGGF